MLIALLLGLGIISSLSLEKMMISLMDMRKGLEAISKSMRQSIDQMKALEGTVDVLKKSDKDFQELRDMKGEIEKSKESIHKIGKDLGMIGEGFGVIKNDLTAISGNVKVVSDELGAMAGDMKELIKSVEAINSEMQESYIGFFNYLNEYVNNVDGIMQNIDAVEANIKRSSDIIARNKLADSQKIIDRMKEDLRRYRRFVNDLGETTSTQQISEIKKRLVDYGTRIQKDAKQLRNSTWAMVDARYKNALSVASRANTSASDAINNSAKFVGKVKESTDVAIKSSSLLGKLTERLTMAITNVDKSLGQVPEAIGKATKSMDMVKESMVGTETAMKSTEGSVKQGRFIRIVLIVVCLIAVAFGVFVVYGVYRIIVNPLSRFTSGVRQASEYDLTVSIEDKGTSGEIKELIDGFNRLMKNIRESIKGVHGLSASVFERSQEFNSLSSKITNDMGKQAYGTGRSLVAVQEMSATITDIAKNTESAASSANEANASAEKGLAVVNNTTGSMREIASSLDTALTGVSELSEDSKKISEITQIINEIADQTNLLALNAAIEAARAGEQGRGFAVVADEVRKLAERTGSATQDISDMIRRIQARIEHNVKEMNECGRKSEDGVRNAAEAGEALQQINEAIGKVNDMTNRIVAAIEEQSAASNEVAEGISNINIISEETNRSAAELAKHAQELLHLAESLRKQVSIFKV